MAAVCINNLKYRRIRKRNIESMWVMKGMMIRYGSVWQTCGVCFLSQICENGKMKKCHFRTWKRICLVDIFIPFFRSKTAEKWSKIGIAFSNSAFSFHIFGFLKRPRRLFRKWGISCRKPPGTKQTLSIHLLYFDYFSDVFQGFTRLSFIFTVSSL